MGVLQNGWVYKGKSHLEMNDNLGYPNFRKSPNEDGTTLWYMAKYPKHSKTSSESSPISLLTSLDSKKMILVGGLNPSEKY